MLLPLQIAVLLAGVRYVKTHHEAKRNYLIKTGRGLNPSIIEYMQGLMCMFMIVCQLVFKSYTNTMIFIFNPCHVLTFCFGLVSLLPFNRFTDCLMSFSIASCFGAWLGIVWAENGELSPLEHYMYYIQHIFAAFMAPFVLYLGGRYSASDQLRWPLPLFGYLGFTLYMRFFLTPVSGITWANLNHTLCGVDNDPWRKYFQMGKYYYLWAECYLGLTSVVTQYFIGILGIMLIRCRRFSIHGDSSEKFQALVGILLIFGLSSFAYHAISHIEMREQG